MLSIPAVVAFICLKIAPDVAGPKLRAAELSFPALKAFLKAVCWFERRVSFASIRRKLRNGSGCEGAVSCGMGPASATDVVTNARIAIDREKRLLSVIECSALN
jgi:hypothetical protein